MPKAFWPYNLSESLIDAVTVWSEFLKGERNSKEWGVAAAAMFLKDSGFGKFENAIPQETLRKLIVLLGSAKTLSNPAGGTRQMKQVRAFEALAREISPFFETNCDVRLEPDLGSTDFAQADWLDADADALEDVARVIKNEFRAPQDALDSVDIQARNLYDTVPADATNDYSAVPPSINDTDFSQREYDVIGQDVFDNAYFQPPPPESFFEAIDGAP